MIKVNTLKNMQRLYKEKDFNIFITIVPTNTTTEGLNLAIKESLGNNYNIYNTIKTFKGKITYLVGQGDVIINKNYEDCLGNELMDIIEKNVNSLNVVGIRIELVGSNENNTLKKTWIIIKN